jgi:hypothetical protein
MVGRIPLGKQLCARGVQDLKQKVERITKLEISNSETLEETESQRSDNRARERTEKGETM